MVHLHDTEEPVPKQVAALGAAAELYRFLPPAERACVYGNLALEHAALGHDLASGRFLELARVACGSGPYAEPGWGYWSTRGELDGWDDARPQVFTALRSLRLERSAEVLDLFGGALAGTTRPIRRAHLQYDLLETGVALDGPDRACMFAYAVLDAAKAHRLSNFPPGSARCARGSRSGGAGWRRCASWTSGSPWPGGLRFAQKPAPRSSEV